MGEHLRPAAASAAEPSAFTVVRDDDDAIVAEGSRLALAANNRGPLAFKPNGDLADHILDAYEQFGFYVFEGAVGDEELADLRQDIAELLERAPTQTGGELDKHGRPAEE